MPTKHFVWTTVIPCEDDKYMKNLCAWIEKCCKYYHVQRQLENTLCLTLVLQKAEHKSNFCARLFSLKATKLTPMEQRQARLVTKHADDLRKREIDANTLFYKYPKDEGYVQITKTTKLKQNFERRKGVCWHRKFVILMRQECKCNECEKVLTTYDHDLDHISQYCESFDNSNDNLQYLCLVCHRKKTSMEQSKRQSSYRKYKDIQEC